MFLFYFLVTVCTCFIFRYMCAYSWILDRYTQYYLYTVYCVYLYIDSYFNSGNSCQKNLKFSRFYFCCVSRLSHSLSERSQFGSWNCAHTLSSSWPSVSCHRRCTDWNWDEITTIINWWCSTPKLFNVIELDWVVSKTMACKTMANFLRHRVH